MSFDPRKWLKKDMLLKNERLLKFESRNDHRVKFYITVVEGPGFDKDTRTMFRGELDKIVGRSGMFMDGDNTLIALESHAVDKDILSKVEAMARRVL